MTGETLIPLVDRDQKIPIREFIGRSGFKVWALNQATMSLEPARVSNAFSTGIKPVFKLKTGDGRSLRATGNHKFLTMAGWQRLDELKIGQQIAIPLDEFPKNRQKAWDEIVSIEADGKAEVYDLTVDEHHNFVANNIIVHNSIEQDADLVIMLYRDEYYNPDTQDRGIAEVSIAKHRNGPTGTVKLLFEGALTKFKNLARQ